MKIAILDNDIRVADPSLTTGVQTYGIHLQDGFTQLGIQADLVGFTKSGRRVKAVDQCPQYNIHKISDRIEVLNRYDLIIILIGFFKPKEGDYEFLRQVNKKFIVIEHSNDQSYRKHGYEDLMKVIGKHPVVCNSKSSVVIYKNKYGIDAHLIHIPFSKNLMPEGVSKRTENKPFQVVFPSRLLIFKKVDTAIHFMQEEISDAFPWEFTAYGYASGTAIWWTDLKDQLDENEENEIIPFIDKRIRFERPYRREQLPEVYKNADITFNTTQAKNDGGKLECVLLESIFYGVPVCIHDNWIKGVPPDQVDDTLIPNETYLPMDKEGILKFYNDIEFRKRLIDKSQKMLEDHYDAKLVAQKFLNLIK